MYKCERCGYQSRKREPAQIQHFLDTEKTFCKNCFKEKIEVRTNAQKSLRDLKKNLAELKESNSKKAMEKITETIDRIKQAKKIIKGTFTKNEWRAYCG